MQENTNKAIILNSIILYVRLAVTALCGLFITRYALNALGVNDYGLYSVVGSIITFISIINTMMLSTSNRFIATAIGRGDEKEINKVFNVNVLVHLGCAFAVLLLGLTVGDYYVGNYVNYDGDINLAIKVFNISLIASAISFLGVPFNGLLMAKERFYVFCILDIIIYPVRLLLCYLLQFIESDRLILYAIISALCTLLPTICYYFYCESKFHSLVKFSLVKDRSSYSEVLKFSAWVGYGAVAQVGKSQGAALIINAFFTTVMNTALGIANQLHSFILMFVQNISKPISPQITKSYSAGNFERCHTLMVITSKLSYMFMLFISMPFLLCPEFLINLWLGYVPPYSVLFVRLIIINSLVDSLNLGISEYIFASGKIFWYQFVTNTILLLSILAGYLILKIGTPAEYLLYVYIVFSAIAVIARQIILHIDHGFDNGILIKGSYLPSLLTTVMMIPIFFLPDSIHSIVKIIISSIYLLILIYLIGLKSTERLYINAQLTRFINRSQN